MNSVPDIENLIEDILNADGPQDFSDEFVITNSFQAKAFFNSLDKTPDIAKLTKTHTFLTELDDDKSILLGSYFFYKTLLEKYPDDNSFSDITSYDNFYELLKKCIYTFTWSLGNVFAYQNDNVHKNSTLNLITTELKNNQNFIKEFFPYSFEGTHNGCDVVMFLYYLYDNKPEFEIHFKNIISSNTHFFNIEDMPPKEADSLFNEIQRQFAVRVFDK